MSPEWQDYRRRLVQFVLVFPTSIFALWLVARLLLLFVPHEVVLWIDAILMACVGLAFITTIVRLQAFRCPRCGNRFFMGWYKNPFAKRCLHCGLPKWQEPPYEATRTI
jgi:ribosomal protein S27AE